MNVAIFFENSFFCGYETPPVAVFMSTQKGRERKRGVKERGKTFLTKKENENISFNFYLRVFFLLILACLFFVFISSDKLQNLVSHLLIYSEAGTESCSVKQLFGRI